MPKFSKEATILTYQHARNVAQEVENMTSLVQNKLISKCDQFNFSSIAKIPKIRICKDVVLSSLDLSVAYALNSVANAAYHYSMDTCNSGSLLDCARVSTAWSKILPGVVGGIIAGIFVIALQPKQSPPQFLYIHPKDRQKYETIIQIAYERRNILLEITLLKQDPKNNEDKSVTSKLMNLIALNEELEKKQSLLWMEMTVGRVSDRIR